jgi:hypothetical protein
MTAAMTTGRPHAVHVLPALDPTPTVRGDLAMTTVPKELCKNGDGRLVHARYRCRPCYEVALQSGEILANEPRALKISWHPAWTARAICRSGNADDWFSDDRRTRNEARQACLTSCPVRQECLDLALSMPGNPPGIWGGTHENERDRLRQAAREQEVAA